VFYDELLQLYLLGGIGLRMMGHVEHKGKRIAYRVCVGKRLKRERERELGRPNSRWENNIKMDIKETGWEGVHWNLSGSVLG
jgi:hypothetical protein